MAVTANPLAARGLRATVRGRPQEPLCSHSAPASDETVLPSVSIEKLDNLTIDAIAYRDETDRRIVQQLSGRALLDRNLLPRWPANGGREPVAGGCAFYASPPPDQTPG